MMVVEIKSLCLSEKKKIKEHFIKSKPLYKGRNVTWKPQQ